MSHTLNYVLRDPNDAADELDRLILALERIDAIAVTKKAGALVKMQRVARQALDISSETRGWKP